MPKFPQFCAKSENVSAANKTGCVTKHFENFARADNAFFQLAAALSLRPLAGTSNSNAASVHQRDPGPRSTFP